VYHFLKLNLELATYHNYQFSRFAIPLLFCICKHLPLLVTIGCKDFVKDFHRFLELSPEDKINFELGRRFGVYSCLDDMDNQMKRQAVKQYAGQLIDSSPEVIENVIWELMERFI